MGSVPVADCDVLRGFYDRMGFGSSSGWPLSSSLILDGERGELVKAPYRTAKKGLRASLVSELKAAIALKTHSEAERRRRERINGHLKRLRGLVPTATKMDKAALLAEVITQVKELTMKVQDIRTGYNIPSNTDEVQVDAAEDQTSNGRCTFKASICCDYRRELLRELLQALDSISLNTLNVEFLIFEDRIRFFVLLETEGNISSIERHSLLNSLQQALTFVADQAAKETDHVLPRSLPA